MAAAQSPSSSFPMLPGSPYGVLSPGPEGGGRTLSGSMNWEPVRKRLLGDDMKDAFDAVQEIRDRIEIVHTVEFPLMLSALLPAFSTILGQRTTPSPDNTTIEHKLRNVVLEVISRMPSNEVLRPHAPHLVAVALDVLNRDYEENALIASKIVFDLYKVYRSLPQDYVQPFLDFVQGSYRSLPTSVQRNFLLPALAAGPPPDTHSKVSSAFDLGALDDKSNLKAAKGPDPSNVTTPAKQTPAKSTDDDNNNNNQAETPKASTPAPASAISPSMAKLPTSPIPRISPRSNSSFRVLTECPLSVMLMFQLFPKFMRNNIPILINVMMEALSLRAPPMNSIAQGDQSLDAYSERLYSSRCRELVAAQAKTLSFLTYLLRGFSNDLKPYEDRLASNVVALMQTCPREFISTRKELLVATRHLLNSDFRNGFFRHVDSLLDERVLMGSHHRYSEQTILRPLGYTTLSDLVHHVRSMLKMAQMSRVVSTFSRVLHDSSMNLPISTQYTAVRTLLSVVDIIFHNKDPNPQIGRDLLVRVMKTLVEKLSTLQHADETVSSRNSTGINLEGKCKDDTKESQRDLKSMIRAIIVGHKTLIWYINNYRTQREKEKIENTPPQPGANEEVASALLKMTHSEHALIDKYISLAFPCMKRLKGDTNASSLNDGKSSAPVQYRDSLTYFAASFTALDGSDMRKTLGKRLDLLVDAIADDQVAILVPRHILSSNASASYEFCGMLLDFLVQRMDEFMITRPKGVLFLPSTTQCDGSSESTRLQRLCSQIDQEYASDIETRKARASAYLQLFERVLKSLTSFPQNERALRPYLRNIVSICLRSAMEKTDFSHDNYCMILRYVFRSISAGKFEDSYRELLPLIPTIFNGLYRIFQATDDVCLHHIVIELLLTIPARLSSLLPHMNLLLRVIIRALESSSGDLVNLGLRTMEFWIDNLNPEFLFPELSKEKEHFVRLTKALSVHLMPAPYPYGLLTLRLLGKLGGKNRQVLREPFDVSSPRDFKHCRYRIAQTFGWTDEADKPTMDTDQPNLESGKTATTFQIALPVNRCVEILKNAALAQELSLSNSPSYNAKETSGSILTWQNSEKLLETRIDQTDLLPYCTDVIRQTRECQVDAAMSVLRSTLTEMLGVQADSFELIDALGKSTSRVASTSAPTDEAGDSLNIQTSSEQLTAYSNDLGTVCLGLMYGCAVQSDRDNAIRFVKGLITHMFLVVSSHQEFVIRIDANGSALHVDTDQKEGDSPKDPVHGSLFEVGLGSLKPFGYFKLTGPLKDKTDPMVINTSLAKFLSCPYAEARNASLDLLRHLLRLPEVFSMDGGKQPAEHGDAAATVPPKLDRGCLVIFENLLSALCRECLSSKWHMRDGLYEAIVLLIDTLGSSWSQKYEIELINVGLFAAKSVPREMSIATVNAFKFLVRVCNGLYGRPAYTSSSAGGEGGEFVYDVLSVLNTGKDQDRGKNQADESEACNRTTPSNEVMQVVLVEIASTRQMVRLASRYILKHYLIERLSPTECKLVMEKHMSLIKRVLFSRSLRLLPLPEQVGTVEALAIIVDQVPNLMPLDDQHLLAFLSELLKMSSVADGEMSDGNLGGYVVDKNGYAVRVDEKSSSKKGQEKVNGVFSSSVFNRRDCVVKLEGCKILLDEELPLGVQLRVSTITLLRSVIRGHPNPFFDAETSSPIGNIRPHVVSLLFRSLVSCPLKAVIAAHDALRDVLTSSVLPAEEGAKSKSRLRKELLQTCIRPVLLNLRDYTRLSVNLLRGLSRLLSLLSSWFNKTLGEKLLDHLQKWTDPNRLKLQKIWKEGEEPDVAAAVVDLFVLLPHASQFVEPLVKTVIKLEACLPSFKSRHVVSPYRKPLARYLNKHCQYTVSFFFQRLKTPLYSELFQDIVKLDDSIPLREYLSGRHCSVSLLNVCFERPLAIIRSEKNQSTSSGMSPPKAGSTNSMDILFLHGIQPLTGPPPSQKELLLRQEVETKKKRLLVLQQELARRTETLKSKSASGKSPASEGPSLEEAKKQHKIAKSAYERGAKELNESKQRYSAEMAQSMASKSPNDPSVTARPMTVESLELQHQGFRLVESLMKGNKNYLKDHNDVLRAFRWLWRSKGRYLRLQHEEAVPPRYHEESKLLASFLISYAQSFPNDVDLLFELIRIFLQSSASDFSFVKSFLANAVGRNLSADQKKQIMQRFFALLAGESTEEIKTLSVQLVVFPMLCSSFSDGKVKKSSKSHSETVEPSTPQEKENTLEGAKQDEFDFIDPPVVKKFVEEVLFQKGNPIACGDRLRIELLRLANVFLEFVPAYIDEVGKDLIKFCWNLLKSDDMQCKNWAYIVVCRYIATLGTPPKIIMQVYVSLLRSHQQESKELIRNALDLLVPSLPKILDGSDMKKAMEWTTRIMFEEGNSIPQLAHIWQTIVNHSSVFFAHRYQFVRYMVNSLNRLGLPPNCQPENRALAVSVIELVVRWDNSHVENKQSDDLGKRIGDGSPSSDSKYMHADKRRKTDSGGGSDITFTTRNFLLDQSMVDTMANFIVRLKILLADPKVDTGSFCLDERLVVLFRDLMARWHRCMIRPVYFEKVVAMCKEYNSSYKFGKNQNNSRASNAKKSPPKTPKSGSGGQKGDESKQVSAALLVACLDIFKVLSEVAPSNGFLWDNSSQVKEVLSACFRFARNREESQVREKLGIFTVNLMSSYKKSGRTNSDLCQFVCVLLERCLVEGDIEYSKSVKSTSSSPETNRNVGTRPPTGDGDDLDDEKAIFALEVIDKVSRTDRSFVERFSSTLLSLLNTLVKKHASAAAAKQKQVGVSFVPQSGTYSIRQMYHTPVTGILTDSFPPEVSQWTSSGTSLSGKNKDHYPSKELEFDRSLRSTVLILEMLGSSEIAYSFSESRKSLVQAISSILESSNSVQLLMTAVRIVGKWLLSDESGGPLTVKERNSFLWKISSFDFNGLSDVVAQPLADLVSHYVITFLRRRTSKLRGDSPPNAPSGPRVSDSDDIILGRSLVACLMTPNHFLRDTLLSLYVSQRNGITRSDGRIPVCSPIEILWQLLHSDFEGLGGRYWIVVFVDLMVAIARTLPLPIDASSVENGQRIGRKLPPPQRIQSQDALFWSDLDARNGYAAFCKDLLNESSDLIAGGQHLTTALRRLAHGDICICQSLFQELMRAGWDAAPNDALRLRLVPAIESLLSRPFHSQFLKRNGKTGDERSSNAVRAFLNGIYELSPLPVLDVDLLVSLAETYNSWYEVLSILEDQHLIFSSNNELSGSNEKLRNKMFVAMRHCYRQLSESNVVMGLALDSCNMPETRRAVSLDSYGKVDDALESYASLMELVESRGAPASDCEMNLWEERWVHLNREQCQLPVVAEYARAANNSQLMLECAWKQQDWERVRSFCSSPDLVAAAESGDPRIKMSETLLAVVDGKLSDVENLHAQTAQLCLYKWQLLPSFTNASMAHASLLHFFHRLLEIRESGHIMVETNNHSNGKKTLPDLKNLLTAWRHRLPNNYEDLSMWDDVFTWRSHMFSAITSNFHWSEPSTLATLHDRPWTAIRMSITARKQGLRQTALLLLNRLADSSAMDVSDAYLKLREQILAYNNPESELERTGGLNLINTTNLSFFDAKQKSELFRLKAIFLSSIRHTSKSNQAYCHSVQICPSYAKAWVSWGGLCSSLGALTEKQLDQMASKGGNSESSKDTRAATTKKVAQYLAQAMGCYLEAIQIDTHEKSRIHLPRCLWILTKDGSSPGVLCQTLENRGSKLPAWVWLPWIPQLLTGLCRIEGHAMKTILTCLVKAYPQAVYYSLRAFYLERRDVERAKGVSSSSTQHMPSVAYAEEMMSTLRRSHASLWSSLEAILEELIVKFRPSYEEELLATISALLERAESHAEKQYLPDKKRLEDEDAMVASWSKTLSRIASKFFRTTDSTPGSNRRDERVKKTADFKRKYKEDFEVDFRVSSSESSEGKPQFRLSEYIVRLQRWKRKLEAQVACTPVSLPLVESSHSLAMFSGDVPDLWPGACDTKFMVSNVQDGPNEDDESNRGQSSTSSSAAIARRAAVTAALAVADAAAHEGTGGEFGGGSATIEIPGQYCPNSSTTADIKPCPELHAKLVRFEPFVDVLRRNDQLVRRTGMVGSDGKTYRFLLQFAIPYWTRTDERTAQTHYIIDKFLRENLVAAKNHLSIQPSAAIPVAQRLRMTLDVESRIALDDVWRVANESNSTNGDAIPAVFLDEVAKRMSKMDTGEGGKDDKNEKERAVRLDVYKDIASKKVDNRLLLRYVQSAMNGPESLFHFRRAFSSQLAANSLLQYIFSVAERNPQRFVILQNTARMLSPDFRVMYSNQGFIENQLVPFRMTPNVEALVGKPYLEGRFIKSFAMIAAAVKQHRDRLDPILRLLMRDDILAWYSKSLAKTDSKTQELERQLIERVSKNVLTLQSKFSECAASTKQVKGPIDCRVRELYASASNPEKLCMMPTSYHAWL